jgi:hypothetical protein
VPTGRALKRRRAASTSTAPATPSSPTKLAGQLRLDLAAAGVKRIDLSTPSEPLSLANGTTENWGWTALAMHHGRRRIATVAPRVLLVSSDSLAPLHREPQIAALTKDGGPRVGHERKSRSPSKKRKELKHNAKPKWRNGRRDGFKIRYP